MIHFLTFFLTGSLLVMFLGAKQQKPGDRCAIAAGLLVAVLALTAAAMLRGTVLFAPAAFAIAVLQIVHHMIANFNDAAAEQDRCAPFRCNTARCHFTGIAAAATAGLVSMLRL